MNKFIIAVFYFILSTLVIFAQSTQDWQVIDQLKTNIIEDKVDTIPDEIQDNVFKDPEAWLFKVVDYLMEDAIEYWSR